MHILIVEDNTLVASGIQTGMELHGFTSDTAASVAQATAHMARRDFDACVLDLGLPDGDGIDLLRHWRAQGRDVPVLILTARGTIEDKMAGFQTGTDDYLTKPFHMEELLARIRAVLRRRAPEQVNDSVTIGELVLDAATYRVTYQGQPLKVGPTEFKLLHFLMKHSERVHSRSQLLDKVWGDHVFIEERTVDVHVKRLREALGAAGAMVETVRGAGYRLTAQPQALLRA